MLRGLLTRLGPAYFPYRIIRSKIPERRAPAGRGSRSRPSVWMGAQAGMLGEICEKQPSELGPERIRAVFLLR
jgi:hypothetical protein